MNSKVDDGGCVLGRPSKSIDLQLLDRLCQFPMKNEDIAFCLGVSLDTLERRVRAIEDSTFAEFKHKRGARLRLSLVEKQIEVAMRGNVSMLIWLGKQYLGQSDHLPAEEDHSQNVFLEPDWLKP